MTIQETTTSIFDPLSWDEAWPVATLMVMAVSGIYLTNKNNAKIAENNELLSKINAYLKNLGALGQTDLKTVNIRAALLNKQVYENLALVKEIAQQSNYMELLVRSNETTSPMHVICQNDQVKALETLFLLKANALDLLEQKDNEGNTPLHLAVLSNSKAIIEMLAERKDSHELFALKDKKGNTPLHLICIKNGHDLFSLLSTHASFKDWLKVENDEKQTPEQITTSNGTQRMKETLTLLKLNNSKVR